MHGKVVLISGAAGLGGDGAPASSVRLTTGGESSAQEIAERIFVAIAKRQRLLLPDRTSRLAWWLSRLAPQRYASIMKRRVSAEFDEVRP